MRHECLTDVRHNGDESVDMVLGPEGSKDLAYFGVPVFGTYGTVNAFISEDGELVVFHGHVDEHTVTVFRLLHLETEENFRGAVHGIHEPAFAFDEDADLAAGAEFRLPDRLDDPLFFTRIEEMPCLSPV
jgi:hypothetical protein